MPPQLQTPDPEPELAGLQRLAPSAMAGSALGLALLIGFAAYGYIGDAQPVMHGDRVSNEEAVRLADSFGHSRGSLIPITDERIRDEWLAGRIPLSPERARTAAMIANGERLLGSLTLWDNFDEDGDVVSVSAGGMTQTITLMHAPQRVLIAYAPGQSVYITGEHDGGGGVTVAVELSTGPLPLPPLAVGQTVELPLQ